jgi:hypothetical protein
MKSEGKAEDFNYEEIDHKINEYKNNLSQIETILEREKEKLLNFQIGGSNMSRINELTKVQRDLKSAIEFQEDIRRYKIILDPKIFNSQPLDQSHVGRICTAFFEPESQWHLAIVNSINYNEKTAEITWLGYKEKSTVQWSFVKIQQLVRPDNLEEGMSCDAIYYEEGKWYHAEVEKISELGVHVKYKKYNDIEVVSFDSIRFTPEQNLSNLKRKQIEKPEKNENNSVESAEFKLPEYLKITPADNEMQRLSKRKRVKALKYTHKEQIIEKFSKEKQDNWLSFSQQASKNKLPGMKKFEKK